MAPSRCMIVYISRTRGVHSVRDTCIIQEHDCGAQCMIRAHFKNKWCPCGVWYVHISRTRYVHSVHESIRAHFKNTLCPFGAWCVHISRTWYVHSVYDACTFQEQVMSIRCMMRAHFKNMLCPFGVWCVHISRQVMSIRCMMRAHFKNTWRPFGVWSVHISRTHGFQSVHDTDTCIFKNMWYPFGACYVYISRTIGRPFGAFYACVPIVVPIRFMFGTRMWKYVYISRAYNVTQYYVYFPFLISWSCCVIRQTLGVHFIWRTLGSNCVYMYNSRSCRVHSAHNTCMFQYHMGCTRLIISVCINSDCDTIKIFRYVVHLIWG